MILPMKKVLSAIVFIATIVLACQSTSREEKRYWMMSEPVPESGVRVWIPESGQHDKDCDQEKTTPALALATIYNIVNDVNEHKIHYHIRNEDNGGLILSEYLSDEDGKGERRLGSKEAIHYHGVYVNLEAAKQLLTAVKSHQHGAD
jgi:hypothetical protein